MADSQPVRPWERPRETELLETFPAHVVFSWLGHTAAVARSQYLQTTDFDRAASNPAHSGAIGGHPTPSGLHETREKRGITWERR